MEIRSNFISGLDRLPDASLVEEMKHLDAHTIGNVNWKEYPYRPDVNFRIAHSEDAVVILFSVKEDHVRAVSMDDNGPVWEDSCVEFFVKSPVRTGYFNFEVNCVGTALGSYRVSRTDDSGHFSSEVMDRIRRICSLPHRPIDDVTPGQEWWLVEVVPFSLLGLEEVPEQIQANFYKCGDKCNQMHFLSWNKIDLPAPDFHCPQFFGTVRFR